MSESTSVQTRRNSIRAPKVGHKKSRKGCQTCKSRRVKCDETYPECHVCRRLGLTCSYAYAETSRISKAKATERSNVAIKSSPGGESHDGESDLASIAPVLAAQPVQSHSADESKQRRFMELRLMHHWMVYVSRPFGMTSPASWKELWWDEVPRIALQNENVLYALFAMSATHLLGRSAHDEALVQARLNYWVWALREQTAAVAKLGQANTDAVAFAALLITMNALAMLQERNLDPYEPPSEWLEVGRGAFAVLPDIEKVDDHPGLKVLIETTEPIWSVSARLDPDMHRDLAAVLRQDIPSEDDWNDVETVEGYETALSYIGSFRRVALVGEPAADVYLRWICMFPFMVPRKFTDFILERRPRALVTLAYFFAVVGQTGALQYLGEIGDRTTARREVHAIRDVLPPEWQSLMMWPLGEVEGG